MKKILGILFCIVFMLSASLVFAAGTVTVSDPAFLRSDNPRVAIITFTCKGDVAGGTVGTIPNTAMSTTQTNRVMGMFLHSVIVDPGTVAPDAADVFILNAASEDLLGSADGTTAINGLNLIHATLGRTTTPKTLVPNTSDANYRPLVTGPLTLKVLNQATAEADWTVTLVFISQP